jgi:hypothetical protein
MKKNYHLIICIILLFFPLFLYPIHLDKGIIFRKVRKPTHLSSNIIPSWMNVYPELKEMFSTKIDRLIQSGELPNKLFELERNYQTLTNFGFEYYFRWLFSKGTNMEEIVSKLVDWWIYGNKTLLQLEKFLTLASKILWVPETKIKEMNLRIMDIACGGFQNAPFEINFFKKAKEIFGIDNDFTQFISAVGVIRHWGLDDLETNVHVRREDMRNLKQILSEKGNFDIYQFFHLPFRILSLEDVEKIFSSLKNYMNEKAWIMISIPEIDLENPEVKEIVKGLKESGFLSEESFSTLYLDLRYNKIDYLFAGGRKQLYKFLDYLKNLVVGVKSP